MVGITGAISSFLASTQSSLQSSLASVSTTQTILINISLVVIIAAILAFISRLLKQELILAYILTGIILGPLVLGLIQDKVLIGGFAEIGITFLLFVAGLEMSVKKFKESLGTSMTAGVIQVISVALVSFFILVAFSFSRIEAIWLGIAIAFSSTVVITKLLADKNELNTLRARLIIGIMLAQDIIAIIALAILSKEITTTFVLLALSNLILLGLIALFLNYTILKPVINRAASSSELLFLVSIAFLFLFTGMAYILNLSIAIGAFIAGILLANTPYSMEIGVKTKTLRDFFAIMFFVSIGMWLTNIDKSILLPLLSVFVILVIFEPLVTAIFLRIRGYKARTALDTGFSFAQLSEFTLIITLYALTLGIVSQRGFDLIVLTAVITMAITPYTMKLGGLFHRCKILNFIKLPIKEKVKHITPGKKTILFFGCHRMGTVLFRGLEKYKNKLLVVDFDPDIIKGLERQGISYMYGDVLDKEFLEKIPVKDLKVVLSTIPKKEENIVLINYFKKIKPTLFITVKAEKIHDALELYDKGADYVILPQIIGGEQSVEMIKKLNKKEFKKLQDKHIKYLKDLHKVLY